MTPGTIFISHRAEYGRLVRELKKPLNKRLEAKSKLLSQETFHAERWTICKNRKAFFFCMERKSAA
jgi:hypothetical protein